MKKEEVLKQSFSQFLNKELRRTPNERDTTPVIYYGGKSRDSDWIISHFPPHGTYLDVFGGGGGVFFRKGPSNVDVYNDVGNVALFLRTLRDMGNDLYHALTLTPFSREEFEICRGGWESKLAEARAERDSMKYPALWVEWARMWFTTVNQGYTHEERADSWHVAKQVNSASALASHVDDLPKIINKLRRSQIEHLDFEALLKIYNLPEVLAYCDPPYMRDTRVSLNTYENEMDYNGHVRLLKILLEFKGQVVVSGYDSNLYDSMLKDWRIVRKTAKSAIQNSSSMEGRAERTEVLWIKEHKHGLWSTPLYDS